jgi:ATP-binding cassette subfamily B protein
VNALRTSILFLMLYLIFRQEITIGQFFSLMIYSFFIFTPLQELGNVINIYRETEVSLANFQQILDMPRDPKPDNPEPVDALMTLQFERVSFHHQSSALPALNEISFSAARGDTIAFVGPSGAGKSTLVKLLVGLYPPQHGQILYNGVSGSRVDLDLFRERIGFVTQDSQLFSGSIRENLLFVKPGASDAECLDVLQKASVQSLLDRADRGLGFESESARRTGRSRS